jgi:hypothetical protein
MTINKKTLKKCAGGLLASLLLSTIPTMLVGAESTAITKDVSRDASGHRNELAQLNETTFMKVKELFEQGLSLTQLQVELQNMLTNMPTDVQRRGQNSMSLRGFYGSGIFSCRGFA